MTAHISLFLRKARGHSLRLRANALALPRTAPTVALLPWNNLQTYNGAQIRNSKPRELNMRMLEALIAGLILGASIAGCAQGTGVAAVADAMGATNLNSIEYSGSGELFGFGQAYIPGE